MRTDNLNELMNELHSLVREAAQKDIANILESVIEDEWRKDAFWDNVEEKAIRLAEKLNEIGALANFANRFLYAAIQSGKLEMQLRLQKSDEPNNPRFFTYQVQNTEYANDDFGHIWCEGELKDVQDFDWFEFCISGKE